MVKAYIKELTRRAAEQGIARLSFYLEESSGRNLVVFDGQPEKLEYSEQQLLFVEAEVEGYCGSTFIENFDMELIDEQLETMKEAAIARKKPFVAYEFPQLSAEDSAVSDWMPLNQLLEQLAEAEKAAYAADARISKVQHCGCHESKHCITLMDQDGNALSQNSEVGGFHLGVTAQEGNDLQLGGKGKTFLLNSYPDFVSLAKEAAESAVSKLGSSSYPTAATPVVLDKAVVCELMDAFMPTFFGKNIQNHMSLLEGKLGQSIAGENITISEEPQMENGLVQRRFDDEAVLCTQKNLIEKGIFRSCLYNRQSAAAAEVVSGGNGIKPSFSDEVETGYTNVLLHPGQKSREELLQEMGNGLLITSVSGTFAGANAVSADFSLIAKGYRVENGQIGSGVTQITVAGNFFEMLGRVRSIGNDLGNMYSRTGCVYGPSLYIEQLMISGEE